MNRYICRCLQMLTIFSFWGNVTLAQLSGVTRGPYMNTGTTDGVRMLWKTTSPETGKVWVGLSPGIWSDSLVESGSAQQHELVISGLQADTKYYYAIGAGNVAYPHDTNYYFYTSPDSGSFQPIRIWAIGDFGNLSAGQWGTKNGFLSYNAGRRIDGWIWMGDNAYWNGTDQEYQDKVFDVYPEIFRNTVVWPAPGNHDYGSISPTTHSGPYYEIFSLPENGEAGGLPSGQEHYYSFDIGNVHLVSLNSQWRPWVDSMNTPMLNWLRADLQASQGDWTIVYWHHPPYSKSSHDSDEPGKRMQSMRENVNPILEDLGVDLVLSGHSHAYERSMLIRGHFGLSSTFSPAIHAIDTGSGRPSEGKEYIKYTLGAAAGFGTVYNVVGCSGQLNLGNSLDHPAMYAATDNWHGSLVIEVDSNVLTATFIDTSGTVRDDYRIRKVESTGVSEAGDQIPAFSVRPVPAEDLIIISIPGHDHGLLSFELIDLQGKTVQRWKPGQGVGEIRLPLNQHPPGIYLIQVTSGNEQAARKIFLR